MAQKTQYLTSAQAHENFKRAWIERRTAQERGAGWSVLKELSATEHRAWHAYVDALKREHRYRHGKAAAFHAPERPL